MKHIPCPVCNSSDALSYQTSGEYAGWGKCFSCGKQFPPNERNAVNSSTESPGSSPKTSNFSPLTNQFRAFSQRKFIAESIQRYKIDRPANTDEYEAKYPIFDIEGNHIGNKVRMKDKRFAIEGSMKNAGLMGRHAFSPGGKYLTIVEGQDDMVAAYQMMGSKWPVLSVHSASSAMNDIKRDFEYVNSFENIVLVFDNDEAGKKAAKDVCSIGFAIGKLKVVNLQKYKDANDYLIHGDGDDFVREWWRAEKFKPDGLKLGSEMLDEILNRPNHFSVPYPWEGLNKMTYGLRLSESVLFMADTGVGKTSILKELEHSLLVNPEIKEKGYGVGFLHLEEPNYDTALGLLSVHDSQPYHLPDTPISTDILSRAHSEVLGDNRAIFYDHFGSNSIDEILNKIRHMVALGCKYIVIDHLSIIVSDHSDDERKQLDEISTKLKTMTLELNIAVICVIHTNRSGLARGSAGPEKVANIHISLYRDKKAKDPWIRNVTVLTIEKNRFSGRTGPATHLYYNPETGRMSELDAEMIAFYEEGKSPLEDATQWR